MHNYIHGVDLGICREVTSIHTVMGFVANTKASSVLARPLFQLVNHAISNKNKDCRPSFCVYSVLANI